MMIGCEAALSEVSHRLREERFVTLFVPRGIGNTTAALAVGSGAAEEFSGSSTLLTWEA
jgi:predicted ATPase